MSQSADAGPQETRRAAYERELEALMEEVSGHDEERRRTALPTSDAAPQDDGMQRKADLLSRIRWLQDQIAALSHP